MNHYYQKNIVIIGGGPAGLGAALMLAQRGWKDITVIEKRPSADYYEPDKSFSYQIDGRGQKLTDLLKLTAKLADLSVPSTDFYFTLIQKDGTRKTTKLPIADSKRKTAYWLPRASFVELLYQEIEHHWQDEIKVLFNTKCIEIKQHLEHLEIITQSQDQEQLTFIPTLIVGCDGLNSIVRQTLHQWEKGQSNSFEMQKFPSPSSGLKYKVLTLPPQFTLSEQEGDVAQSTMAYAIRSTFKERKKAINLGLLPFKNPNQPRTANIITYPDHQIWQLETPAEVEQFMKQAFPQIPLEKMISPEEIVRFTSSDGGKFPIPQYCSGLYQIWGKPEESQGTAIILLGDAAHCFPPDIGQGVNSALEDIYVFQEILAETQDNLSQALPRYQNLRQPDIKALIRLVQISYPWQYNQDPLQKRLWSLNFFLRLLLNRVFPFIFNPHSFIMIQNHELSYSDIIAKSNRTTQVLSILVGLAILTLLLKLFN
ncbi:MAG: FAD-dependent monooxygenase [Moorea sp. SIOASIH]|uniref:FAD-dependent oxidoreductase n=1 Tax=Moorena sp. SIOASIH TaxID=2607817 RepID=UPI0013BE8161|nr:NAD(P)/FAD-dependent oxidoreductase [Moorena sp. SIOASIH]NEO40054.1 FAD-dependent monooxygenase [Moorena sp. SIOASIH]